MKKKVIIVGGGFAGIAAAKSLAGSQIEVKLIDKKNHHVFQPLLYQVASAALSPGDISVPLREVVGKNKNIQVLLDEVISIDKENKVIHCKNEVIHQYDYLILSPGSKPFYFGNNTWEEFAPGLKTIEDALTIRNRVLKSFEECEKNNGDELNFVIIGAGPTGVELAGAFAEIAYDILIKEFKSFDSSKANIYLLEGGKEVLPAYSGKLSQKAKKYIEQLGVKVYTGKRVNEVTDEYVKVGDEKIKTKNIIWAAGNIASPLVKSLNVDQDNMGRVIVNPDLSVKGHPEIYVLGDSANVKAKDGKPLPALAPVASQQGRHVAKQILKQKSLEFHYLDKGTMATIGNFKAVMDFRGIKISGALAWFCWSFVHILFLINFRNRLMVFTQWAFAFLFKKKGVRIITESKELP
jgi:NADH dehydrogenase